MDDKPIHCRGIRGPGRAGRGAGRCGAIFAGSLLLWGIATAAAEADRRTLTWFGYYDPAQNFLSAKALLRFAAPADDRVIWLAEGLQLNEVRSGTMPLQGHARQSGACLIQGRDTGELEIRYSGQIATPPDPFSLTADAAPARREVQVDRLSFLSCVRDFYPNAGMDFGSILLSIGVPQGWSCLGSGIQRSRRSESGTDTYVFDNAGAKGLSLVFGRFEPLGRLAGAIPAQLHGWKQLNYEWYFPAADIVRVLDFYHERFGPLDLPELNILFRRGRRFGGISYPGLVVLEVDAAWTTFSMQTRKNIVSDSPLSLVDAKQDVLSHELAHQWWGGLVSWKSPVDNWITEGLATYSSLICLRAGKGENAYRRVLGKLRRQVARYAGLGAPAEGPGLRDREGLRAYQALVYAKPALMLAALADEVGEEELCARLRRVLHERRRSGLATSEFLARLAGGDAGVAARLAGWIQGRGLPAEE